MRSIPSQFVVFRQVRKCEMSECSELLDRAVACEPIAGVLLYKRNPKPFKFTEVVNADIRRENVHELRQLVVKDSFGPVVMEVEIRRRDRANLIGKKIHELGHKKLRAFLGC